MKNNSSAISAYPRLNICPLLPWLLAAGYRLLYFGYFPYTRVSTRREEQYTRVSTSSTHGCPRAVHTGVHEQYTRVSGNQVGELGQDSGK